MAIALVLWWVVLAVPQEPEDPFQEKVLATAPAGGAIKFFSVAPVTGRLAFVAKVAGEEVAFVDGKEAVRSPEIYPIHWSPDGKRWACIIKEGARRLVVADGVRGEAARVLVERGHIRRIRCWPVRPDREGQRCELALAECRREAVERGSRRDRCRQDRGVGGVEPDVQER